MTDKTIIDGVDVSWCEHIFTTRFNPITLKCQNTEPRCRYACSGWCKDNPDCYYKQSARKGERIKELEKKLKQIKELVTDWINNDYSCFQCRINMDKKLQQIKQIAQGE